MNDVGAPRYFVYPYCVSVIILTFRRYSSVVTVPAGRNSTIQGMPYVLISLVAGWWGFPWGPVFTVNAVWRTLRGGIDVTELVLRFGKDPATWPPPPNDPDAPPIVGSPEGWR